MAIVDVGRNPETIILSDNDVMALFNDRIEETVGDLTLSNETDVLYAATAPTKGDRCLIFGRVMTNGEKTGNLYVATYDNGDGTGNVLREVISPRVSYDRKSNVLVVWFWTNFKEGFSGTTYDESQLYLINEDEFDSDIPVVRALCCCYGSLQHVQIDGGIITGVVGASPVSSPAWSLVPIFNKPKILQLRPIPDQAGGYAIIDFAGTGGGGLVKSKFVNTGSTMVEWYDTLTVDIEKDGSTGMISAGLGPTGDTITGSFLALKHPSEVISDEMPDGVDAPAIVYICVTPAGVPAGEIGYAGYITSPTWVKYETAGETSVGMICGAHHSFRKLVTDVPGYRVLALNTTDTLGDIAFVTPDHRPVVMRSQVLSLDAQAKYLTEKWAEQEETGIGPIESSAYVLPPPGPTGPGPTGPGPTGP